MIPGYHLYTKCQYIISKQFRSNDDIPMKKRTMKEIYVDSVIFKHLVKKDFF